MEKFIILVREKGQWKPYTKDGEVSEVDVSDVATALALNGSSNVVVGSRESFKLAPKMMRFVVGQGWTEVVS